MLKVLLLLKRKPGMTMAEFMERYETIHAPMGTKVGTKTRFYARHYLHPGRHPIFGDEVQEPEYDVVTELWYDDIDAFNEILDGLPQHPGHPPGFGAPSGG